MNKLQYRYCLGSTICKQWYIINRSGAIKNKLMIFRPQFILKFISNNDTIYSSNTTKFMPVPVFMFMHNLHLFNNSC